VNDQTLIWIGIGCAALALVFAWMRANWISRQDAGTDRMKEIAKAISEGAMAFLTREYKVLSIFVIAVAALLALANINKEDSSPLLALSFVVGAFCSALAGFFGMKVATKANVRTANAARTGLPQALQIAFSGGSVMGLCVVGLGMLGLSFLFMLYGNVFNVMNTDLATTDAHHWHLNVVRLLNVISGFSLGASSIALFARVGGGIYTKAADVGADLVGKVEAGIPEDDPRNPAVIADNVGDNVGDVAGMGADLFESYVGSIVGTMILGAAIVAATPDYNGLAPVLLPLVLAGVGILASIIGTFFVRTKEGGNPQAALNIGSFGAAVLMLVGSYFVIEYLWPATNLLDTVSRSPITALGVFGATIFGLVIGVLVGISTEHYCATGKGPVNRIVEQSVTGTATNIIAGLGVGMQSTAIPLLLIAAGILGSYYFAGLYGVAIAALGMLSTTGIQLAVDAYGPISDNSGGIAEMSHLEPAVRQRTDKLDAVGNTTAAIGKGFAIASAALTALALFSAYMTQVGITTLDLANPKIMAGLFVGGMLPFLFSSMAMNAVGRAAMDMIKEVRRQFKEIPGLLEGKPEARADYKRCVDISTTAAIRQMIIPGLMAVVVPVAVGFMPGLGKESLGGLLAGVTVTGVLLAIFMANAGGAWDNAKKSFEGGYKLKSGEVVGKGSDPHKAAVVGDTVGDPFKDTAGPSLNILIKLMSVVALVIAPLIK
jgi:K(+)-stimulated pyrophosphate-energized sodium pump